MKGIKLTFAEGGTTFDFTEPVEGIFCTIQNSLVNIGTPLESDAIYPEKGTRLLMSAVRGVLVNLVAAGHQSNFAALDTLFFINTYSPLQGDDRLKKIRLLPAAYDGNTLTLDSSFEFSGGRTIGVSNTTI